MNGHFGNRKASRQIVQFHRAIGKKKIHDPLFSLVTLHVRLSVETLLHIFPPLGPTESNAILKNNSKNYVILLFFKV